MSKTGDCRLSFKSVPLWTSVFVVVCKISIKSDFPLIQVDNFAVKCRYSNCNRLCWNVLLILAATKQRSMIGETVCWSACRKVGTLFTITAASSNHVIDKGGAPIKAWARDGGRGLWRQQRAIFGRGDVTANLPVRGGTSVRMRACLGMSTARFVSHCWLTVFHRRPTANVSVI